MLAAACIVLASCQKDPDTDKLDNHYLVYTNYDSGTDFAAIESFYVIDSILIIGNSEKPTYWNNNNSQQIINAYSDKLEGCGYIQTETAEEADVILQLSYIHHLLLHLVRSGTLVERLSRLLELGRLGLVLSLHIQLQLQHRFYHR